MSDNRPPRYEEDGKVIYRASGLGMCDKMFVALAMGYDPKAHPAWFQEILDEGTANEEIIRDMYCEQTAEEDANFTGVGNIGRVLEMEVMDGVWIRGSIDGHSNDLIIPTLNEYKKIRDSGWMRYLQQGVEFQHNYPMQTAFYMFALGEASGVDWVPMDFTGGHYVQDEKTGDWSITEIHTHHYTDPPVPLRAIKQRIARLERLCAETDAIGDLPCSVNMYPCPMYYLHDEDAEEPPVRPTDDIVEPLLQEFAALEIDRLDLAPKVRKIEDRQRELKGGIHAWLQASGQESGDVSTITTKDGTEVAVKYNTFPRAGYEVKPTEVTKVTVKVTKKDGEKVANAPKKSRARKAPAKQSKAQAEPEPADEQGSGDPPPVAPKAKLAPRPGATA